MVGEVGPQFSVGSEPRTAETGSARDIVDISFEDDEVRAARQKSVEPVLRLIEAAQAAGRLRADVAFGDIGLLLVRLGRPLLGPFPRDLDVRLAHRHLDLMLAGLEAQPASNAPHLSGPALTLAQLQSLGGNGQGDLTT